MKGNRNTCYLIEQFNIENANFFPVKGFMKELSQLYYYIDVLYFHCLTMAIDTKFSK